MAPKMTATAMANRMLGFMMEGAAVLVITERVFKGIF